MFQAGGTACLHASSEPKDQSGYAGTEVGFWGKILHSVWHTLSLQVLEGVILEALQSESLSSRSEVRGRGEWDGSWVWPHTGLGFPPREAVS